MADWGTTGIGTFVPTKHSNPYPEIDPKLTSFPRPYVVCIVGASRGIGAEIAKAYAVAGASGVILSSRNVSSLNEVATQCRQIYRDVKVEVVSCDITSNEDVSALARTIEASFGRLDAVIINSGYSGPVILDVIQDDTATIKLVTEVNYLGSYYCAHYLLPLLISSPAPENCVKAFLAVGSTASFLIRGPIANTQYCISKLAQLKLVEHIHEKYKNQGLLAAAVHPGAVMSQMAAETAPKEFMQYLTDDPALCGAFMVWLTKPRKSEPLTWLGGRHLVANWDATELELRRKDIVENDLLKTRLAV